MASALTAGSRRFSCILKNRKVPIRSIRKCSNGSDPLDDNSKDKTNNNVTATGKDITVYAGLPYRSRILRFKSDHYGGMGSCFNSDGSPSLVKVPVWEAQEHIFPMFERVVQVDESLSSIMTSTQTSYKHVGIFVKKPNEIHSSDLSHMYSIGTLATLHNYRNSLDERNYALIRSLCRLKRLNPSTSDEQDTDYAECQAIPDEPTVVTPEIRFLCGKIIDCVKNLQPYFPFNTTKEEINKKYINPIYWSYCASDFTNPSEMVQLQSILEESDVVERLKKTLQHLSVEMNYYGTYSKIMQNLIEKDMRQIHLYNLNRLKNTIDNTINSYNQSGSSKSDGPRSSGPYSTTSKGETSSQEKKIRDKLKGLVVPANVQEVIDEELGRLSTMDKSSYEHNIICSYLENLASVPWGVYDGTETSLSFAQNVLNDDHYGLEDVKDAILEHLAVAARSPDIRGRILCLVGPPGVGKTSVVKSIARALNRKYVRVSVGGIEDSCEIKGHRRTYVGAYPGKIINGLKQAKTMDPVFCVDEIDKLNRAHRGDPSSALLEAFDPEQNSNFLDHYLDVPCDLSKVIFVCTANTTNGIMAPLLDRMEIIRLSGYTSEEKQVIIQKYIIPSIVKSFNISEVFGSQIKIDNTVLSRLTDEYFHEAGLRRIKSCIEKIIRKSLKRIEMGEDTEIRVTSDNMTDYAGHPIRPLRKPDSFGIVGIVTGLTVSDGHSTGSTLDVECEFNNATKQIGQITSTGLLGKSLSESTSVAFNVAKRVLAKIDPLNKSLEENEVRVHFLEGGIEKDGPSAGVSVLCAILSQAMNVPVSQNIAMTGEISLKGRVLAVGGIREKISAAITAGIKTVLIPLENESDYQKLTDQIKSKITVQFIKNVDDLMEAAFPDVVYRKERVDLEINVSQKLTN